MPITYTDSLAGISPAQLEGFFVGWPNPPSPATLRRLLEGSYRRVLAIEAETGRVVGFVSAISDGVLSAYIPLLEVLPAYQGRGVGQALMNRIREALRDLYMVDLLCDPELQPYYERLGMHRAGGMMWRNYDRQNGEPPTR